MPSIKVKLHSLRWTFTLLIVASAVVLWAGCNSTNPRPATPPSAPELAATAGVVAAAGKPQPIRIKAGLEMSYTNQDGVVWLADQGFEAGETTDRGDDLQIANTTNPELYRSEHYGMAGFSCPVPNGRYVVKLHFAETFDEITGPGQRVFSFAVGDRVFKDFDVFARAGGAKRAYIESVPVAITNGRLFIKFEAEVENPEINAIEILPAETQ